MSKNACNWGDDASCVKMMGTEGFCCAFVKVEDASKMDDSWEEWYNKSLGWPVKQGEQSTFCVDLSGYTIDPATDTFQEPSIYITYTGYCTSGRDEWAT